MATTPVTRITPSQARKLTWHGHPYFGYRNTCLVCGAGGPCETMLRQGGAIDTRRNVYPASRGFAHAACIDAGRGDGRSVNDYDELA